MNERALLLAFLMLGCASPATPKHPEPAARPAQSSEEVIVPAPTPEPSQSSPEPAESSDATSAKKTPEPVYVDLKAWLDERQVPEAERKQLPFLYHACFETTVGEPAETVLGCESSEFTTRGKGQARVFRTRLHYSLIGARAKHLALLLDVVHTVTITDKEEMDEPDIVNLAFVMAPDGKAATLDDASGPHRVNCAAALADLEVRAKQPGASAWERFDLHLTRTACHERGSYVWKNGRFRRVTLPKPKSGASSF